VLSTGERIPLDADVVLGRDPRPVDGSSGVPRLVELPFPDVSRLHAVVRIARRIATIEDLGSVNGTTVTSPHGRPERIASGVPVALDVGTTVRVGDLVSFTIQEAA